jgi:hypothetical protein
MMSWTRATVYALLLFFAIAVPVAMAGPKAIGPLAVLAVVICGYFLPTIVAHHRKVPNGGSVLVINLFLGWTLVGWVVALAMAARTVPQPA